MCVFSFGEIESIRVLHERFCAFVNFKNANMAAKALDKLQVSDGPRNRLHHWDCLCLVMLIDTSECQKTEYRHEN